MFIKKLLDFIIGIFARMNHRERIALSNYPEPTIDHGILDIDQELAMRGILTAASLGHEQAFIPELTQEQFDAVVTQLGMYFGNFDLCKNIALKRGDVALVNLDIYRRALAHKTELDRRVGDALITMHEGADEYKLEQVSKYIAKHSEYKYGSNDPLSLLDDGGMCGAYSMLFYKMSTRLGIKTYICFGYASNGKRMGAHAWNMIKLAGGDYFYDVTFYDSSYDKQYLHSETDWNRTYKLNDQSGMFKQ